MMSSTETWDHHVSAVCSALVAQSDSRQAGEGFYIVFLFLTAQSPLAKGSEGLASLAGGICSLHTREELRGPCSPGETGRADLLLSPSAWQVESLL